METVQTHVSPPKENLRHGNDYFKTVVEQLLAPGCEDKLCEFLKKNGLIPKQLRCTNEECKENMVWSKARVVDKYNWVCSNCKKKVPIRHKTFFSELKCDFAGIFNAIDGWCSHKSLQDVSENKAHKTAIGKRVYTMCNTAAEAYVKDHPELSLLGGKTVDGEDAVILIDIFPGGMMTLQPQNNNSYVRKILCIGDTSFIPARVWAQLIETNNEGHVDFKQIAELVVKHVKLHSTIVTSNLLYPYIQNISGFPEVINIKNLMTYDPAEHQKALKNIETIWATTVETCQEIQTMSLNLAEQSLCQLQWRQACGTDAFRSILQHLHQYSSNKYIDSAMPM